MPILAKFTKQPADVQDYDIDFTEWLASISDAAESFTVTIATGITLQTSALIDGVVKVWLAGGEDGEDYEVTATLSTLGGRVKQAEIVVKVREV